MKTYYCVTSAFHDSGRVTANITMTMEADEKPETRVRNMLDRDIYNTWYDTKEEAENEVQEARKMSAER